MEFGAVRTLKQPESVLCAAVCLLDGTQCIAVSRGKRVEFCSREMHVLRTVTCNDLVVQMVSVGRLRDGRLLLLSQNSEYALLENGEIVDTGSLLSKHVDGVRPLCALGLEGFVAVLLTGSRVVLAFWRCGRLALHDRFNHFGSYRILDMAPRGDRVFFLMEDCEGKVVYTHYGQRLPEKDFVHFETGSLPAHTYRVAFSRDRVVLFQKDKVSLLHGGKVVHQTNFANPELRSWVETDDGVLLGMGNGEFIRLRVDSKMDIRQVYDTGFSADSLLRMEALYFGTSRLHGWICFVLDGDDMRVLAKQDARARPQSLCLRHGVGFLAGGMLCHVAYQATPQVAATVRFDGPIKHIWVFCGKLFVSFPERSTVYDLGEGRRLKDFDEIKNASEYRQTFRFNTDSLLVETTSSMSFSVVEWEDILLSSYYKEHMLIYTGTKLQLLKHRRLVRERTLPSDVYMVLLRDFVLVSADTCILCDYSLNVLATVGTHRFTCFSVLGDTLFLVDSSCSVHAASMHRMRELCVHGGAVCRDTLFRRVLPPGRHRYCAFACEEAGYVLFSGHRPFLVFAGREGAPYELSVADAVAFGLLRGTAAAESRLLIARGSEVLVCSTSLVPGAVCREQDAGRDARLVVKLGATDRAVVGSVRNTRQLTSVLACLDAGSCVGEYVVENKMLLFAEHFGSGLVVAGFNYGDRHRLCSELLLLDVRRGVRLLHTVSSPGLLRAVSRHGRTFVASHGSRVAVYEVRRTEIVLRAETTSSVFPLNLRFSPSGKSVFVCDLAGSFCTFRYKRRKARLVVKSKVAADACSVAEALDSSRVLVGDARGHLTLYHSGRAAAGPWARFYYGGHVVDARAGRLCPGRKRRVYFATEGGAVGLVAAESCLTESEHCVLVRLQEHVRDGRAFRSPAADTMLDLDLLLETDVDSWCSTLGVDSSSIRDMLERLKTVF